MTKICLVKLRPACLFEQNALTYILITQCSFLECIYLSASSEYSDVVKLALILKPYFFIFIHRVKTGDSYHSVAVDCFHRRKANQKFCDVLESDISGGVRGRVLSG